MRRPRKDQQDVSYPDATLAETARAERDQRRATYSRKGQAGQLGDPEAATIDYQCWVAIAEWLETDRFFSFAGGANPEREDAPIVSWPELEAAAEAALIGAAAKADKLDGNPAASEAERTAAHVRRGRLFAIHRRIAQQRKMIDQLNRELRARRDARAKAAA